MTIQEQTMARSHQIIEENLRIDGKAWLTLEGLHKLFEYLQSQGAVLKVKCPNCAWSQFEDEEIVGMTPCHSCNSTGYLIEPLIEEIKA